MDSQAHAELGPLGPGAAEPWPSADLRCWAAAATHRQAQVAACHSQEAAHAPAVELPVRPVAALERGQVALARVAARMALVEAHSQGSALAAATARSPKLAARSPAADLRRVGRTPAEARNPAADAHSLVAVARILTAEAHSQVEGGHSPAAAARSPAAAARTPAERARNLAAGAHILLAGGRRPGVADHSLAPAACHHAAAVGVQALTMLALASAVQHHSSVAVPLVRLHMAAGPVRMGVGQALVVRVVAGQTGSFCVVKASGQHCCRGCNCGCGSDCGFGHGSGCGYDRGSGCGSGCGSQCEIRRAHGA